MKNIVVAAILLINICSLFSQEYKFYALSNDPNVTEPVLLCELNPETGGMTVLESYGGVTKGDYFGISPDYKHLLVTGKSSDMSTMGIVQYDINEDGTLQYVIEQFKTGDDQPCHVSISPDQRYAFSANYGNDEISLYNFSSNTISEEINSVQKPDQSKGHYISTDPSGKFVHAVFLGLNRVYNYKVLGGSFVKNSSQEYFALPDGFEPRHMVFHPNNNYVYIVNEAHSSVTACAYNKETGEITEMQNISMLPAGYDEYNKAAAIRIHPNGKFLYASNRGHNSIVAYNIADDGKLTVIEHESTSLNYPRDFNISTDGKFMVVGNQKSNMVYSYRIDELTGELSKTAGVLFLSTPLAFEFLPTIAEEPSTTNSNKNIELKIAYPNPATNEIHFHLTDKSFSATINMYNLSGHLVKSAVINQSGILNIAELPRGSYLLVIDIGTKRQTETITLK